MTFDPRVGVFPGHCPHCGEVINAATSETGSTLIRPKAGDFSICYACLGLMEFMDGGRLRKIERKDLSPADRELVDRVLRERREMQS